MQETAEMANGKIAIVFSGQGAQYPGMGRGLYENSPAARDVFDKAERVRPGTSERIFFGSEAQLAETGNTQPCVFCVGLAAAAALREAGVEADILAGFSLGEIAALTFLGAVSFEDGLRLVCERAGLMREAAEGMDAGMMAVLKLPDGEVAAACAEFDSLYPVNFNSPNQVVVAGLKGELGLFERRVRELGGRAVPLKVGGAFHSPMMEGAAAAFSKALGAYEISRPGIPLYSNVTARPYGAGTDVKANLSKHICSPVLWRESVENMILDGAGTFIETGPGKTLSGLVSRISDKVRVYNAENTESLKKAVEGVTEGAA